ncbi:MAG: SAM-dependent methyltransferase [Geminicoccaceae bacterium]|nr:SAM-dependent methyltransferase [Geminicoccaceae bacterium]
MAKPGLKDRLRALIEAEGPIDVARFMALSLADPEGGYYATRAPIGASGDFVTAPEVSQTFGEMIGAALALHWLATGAPDPFALVELGPGRGTLMADLLRAARAVPGFCAALRLHLVETSPPLIRAQVGALGGFGPVWHGRIEGLPADLPLFVVANEFLDAFPVRQYARAGTAWRERLVGCDASGAFAFCLDPRPLPLGAALSPAQTAAPEGGIVEAAPAREALVAALAGRLARQGGVALLVDYGEADLGHGDTLQAVAGHRKVDPLEAPGGADLTSRVAFGPLLAAARRAGVAAYGPVPQGVFLKRLGIGARLERLAAGAPSKRDDLAAGVARLVEPEGMGDLFKAVALVAGETVPPGFTAAEAGLAA